MRAEVAPIFGEAPAGDSPTIENPINTLAEWRDGCVAAATLDFASLYALLERSSNVLAAIDGGRTLWHVFERTLYVSKWS